MLIQIDNYGEHNVKLALIGNKSDCDNKVITSEEREKFAKSKGILSHDVSAKTGD